MQRVHNPFGLRKSKNGRSRHLSFFAFNTRSCEPEMILQFVLSTSKTIVLKERNNLHRSEHKQDIEADKKQIQA